MFFRPTKEEAAAIADHAYGGISDDKLLGGWKPSNAVKGVTYNDPNTGLNSNLYVRTANGKTEYVYATAGTDPLSSKDLAANALQLFGKSGQYEQSVYNAQKIDGALKDSELTFVGHSLGGGEAAANAMSTGRSAITFNAAALSDATRLNLNLGLADVTNYTVRGEVLTTGQSMFGMKAAGANQSIVAPQSTFGRIMEVAYPAVGLMNSFYNHTMGAVKKAFGN